jgi:hypothetical protein
LKPVNEEEQKKEEKSESSTNAPLTSNYSPISTLVPLNSFISDFDKNYKGTVISGKSNNNDQIIISSNSLAKPIMPTPEDQ